MSDRKLIQEESFYKLYHHQGVYKYEGCQCYGDCGCRESFTPTPYDYYTVQKIGRGGRTKTTRHDTLISAQLRIDLLKELYKNS